MSFFVLEISHLHKTDSATNANTATLPIRIWGTVSFLQSMDSFRLRRLQTSEVPARLQVQQSKPLVSVVTLKQARKRSVVKSLNMASSTKASGSFLKRGTSSSGDFWMNLAAMWKCKVSESYTIDWNGLNSSYPCYIQDSAQMPPASASSSWQMHLWGWMYATTCQISLSFLNCPTKV